MKKQILLTALLIAAISSKAQTVVTDTVTLGSGYANQVWYSLPDGEQGSQAKNNWDIAFRTQAGMSSDIMVNHSGGGLVWVYPKANKSGWSAVDTNGLSTWVAQYNAETKWMGALGNYTNPSDPFDLGWGIYDVGTHFVTGDSLYIIKTQTGKFKKLIIDRLASGIYTFTYANLDGTDSTRSALSKAAYGSKNYAYFNLDTKTVVDREPNAENWDLVFGQYSTGDYAAVGIAGYTVTGVLVNDTLEVAKAIVDPTDRATYNNYSAHTFSKDINGLGYNWKSNAGVIKDSNIYFIRRNNGDIWKLNFTGWISGVSGNGSVIFSKEKLSSLSINQKVKGEATLSIFPNPAFSGQNINIVYYSEAQSQSASAFVSDLSGRNVWSRPLAASAGLQVYSLNSTSLVPGTYILSVIADGVATHQKFVIQ